MKVVYAKLDKPREPEVVKMTFPVETESSRESDISMVIWFEDDLLYEELVEACQCNAIIGMINEKLPKGYFLSDPPLQWEYAKENDKIDLKVYRGVELY